MKCNLCKNTNFFKYLEQNIVKCKRCGLIFKTDMPNFSEEIKRYRELTLDYEEQKRINLARAKLYKVYIKKILKLSKKFRDTLMLDVGCGCGLFVKISNEEFGLKTYGIEISQNALKLAKEQLSGSLIFDEPLREIKFEDRVFDVITLLDVLDHMIEPFEECKEILRILKEDGILFLRIRNATFHITFWQVFKNLFYFLKFIKNPVVMHLYSFNRSTIFRLLKVVGFKKIKIYNSLLTFGDPYRQTKMLCGNLNLMKKIFEFLSHIVFFISFGKILISPSLVVVAKK